MHSILSYVSLLLATLLLLSLLAQLDAGRFDVYADCESCVADGHGWSATKNKCGGFKSKACHAGAGNMLTSSTFDSPAKSLGQHRPSERLLEADATEFYGKLPVIGEIKRMQWDYEDSDFANTLAVAGEPVIVVDSPAVKEWAAFQRWDPSYLSKHITTPISFSANTDPNFLFFRQQTKDKYNSSVDAWTAPSGKRTLTLREFQAKAAAAAADKVRNPTEYLYYYKNVGPNTPFRPLLGDVSPYTYYVVDHNTVRRRRKRGQTGRQVGQSGPRNGGMATAVMWYGMTGVRSTIHYDESYNFYVQIFGSKRWYFSPPSSYPACRVYPMAHPSTRQCQVDWPHIDSQRFTRPTSFNHSGGGGMPLYTAVLHAKEVLFIPPTWLHATEALDTNLALNYWSKGVNAQQHWMDYSLECDAQWKLVNPPLTVKERQKLLWHAIVRVVRKYILRLVAMPETRLAGLSSQFSTMGSTEEETADVAAVVAMLLERFNPSTADGFAEPAGEGRRRRGPKMDWLLQDTNPLPDARTVLCADSAEKKISAVLMELGLSANDTEDHTTTMVLVGDFLEGLGRGLLGHRGVGPFFHRLSALLKQQMQMPPARTTR